METLVVLKLLVLKIIENLWKTCIFVIMATERSIHDNIFSKIFKIYKTNNFSNHQKMVALFARKFSLMSLERPEISSK